MRLRVLFVDDEPLLLEGLRRAFRPYRPTWEVGFAEGADVALRMMESREFDAIVSDLSMPGMDGAALLTVVRDRHPDMLRILMSGHWDPISEVTSEWAHMSFAKPCPIDDLRMSLLRPVELAEQMGDSELCWGIRGVASNVTAHQLGEDLDQFVSKRPVVPPAQVPARWSRLLTHSVAALNLVIPHRDEEIQTLGSGAHNCGPGAVRLLALLARQIAMDADRERAVSTGVSAMESGRRERELAREQRPDFGAIHQEAAFGGFVKDAGALILRAGGCRDDSPGVAWASAYLAALWGVPVRLLASLSPTPETVTVGTGRNQ